MKVGDLATIFAKRSGKPIKLIGLRPGEKMHEDLINYSESPRVEFDGNYYRMRPAFEAGRNEPFTYSSADDVMTYDELEKHLTLLGILDVPLSSFKGVSIEEIVTNRKS
jgi:FlaA1/EpsC-like NDP-sugar epimerase